MKNNNPCLNNKDYTLLNVKLGSVYLFDNYVITHFNEGVDINYDNFREVGLAIKNHFKEKPFGYIANRENSYSINLNDANLFNDAFPNLKAYAIVVYNSLTQRIFEIENHFFKFKREAFKDLENAIDWVEESLSTAS